MTRLPFVFDAHLPESRPTSQTANKPRAFGHRFQHVDNSPVHQTEITRVERDINRGDDLHQSIKQPVGGSLEKSFLASCADGVHDLITFAPLIEKPAEFFRRILHVGIENRDGVTPAEVNASGDSRLVTEIA